MKSLLYLVGLTLLAAVSGFAGDSLVYGGLNGLDPHSDSDQVSVGLALSGGGARGLAGIGVLQAFEEKNIRVRAIAGTSIGAIVGGLYACGYDTDQLRDFAKQLDFSLLLSNRAPRRSTLLSRRSDRDRHILTIRFDGLRPYIPQAWTGAQELTSLLTQLTNRANYLAGEDFCKLPVPFKAVATDVISGEAVILDHGTLAEAMRASMAFPLAFTGVELGDRLLMDGGMVYPVPTSIVKEMVGCSDLVVAVNTTSPLVSGDELVTPVDIAGQVTTIMTADQLVAELAKADLVIAPLPNTLTSIDFDKSDSLIAIGYRAGLIAADSIRLLAANQRGARALNTAERILIDPAGVLDGDSFLGQADFLTTEDMAEWMRQAARNPRVFEVKAVFRRGNELHNGGPGEMLTADSTVKRLDVYVTPALRNDEVSVEFLGNTVFDDLRLAHCCHFDSEYVSAADVRRAVDSMEALYTSHGYDLANVVEVNIDDGRRRLTFRIDEGIVRRIDVRNNERTKDWLVRSYFPLRRGHPYSTNDASRGLTDLYGTELFDGITLDLRPIDTGAIVTVRVKEKKYTQLRLGWHWHEEYDSEEFVELLDDNVAGVGLQALAHAQYGTERQDYNAGMKIDRIFSTYLTARLNLHYRRHDRDLFRRDGSADGRRREERWGGDFFIGQHITRLGMVSGGVRMEQLQLHDNLRGSGERLGLRTLHLEAQLENFDQSPFPNSGNRHHLSLEIAGKLVGGDVNYTKFEASLESYYPLGHYLTFHPRFLLGLSRRGLPSSEKFYAGGMHSFWGFRANELSGDKIAMMGYELRIKLPLRLYLSGRFDVGDVYTTTESIKAENLRTGIGAALAADSPIGPIEIGIGGGTSPKDHVYFSAGLSF